MQFRECRRRQTTDSANTTIKDRISDLCNQLFPHTKVICSVLREILLTSSRDPVPERAEVMQCYDTKSDKEAEMFRSRSLGDAAVLKIQARSPYP